MVAYENYKLRFFTFKIVSIVPRIISENKYRERIVEVSRTIVACLYAKSVV